MIGRLSGRIARKAPQTVLLDVHGVGYQLTIPLSTFYTLAAEGEEAVLEVSTQVREDAITLFGFATPQEKALFEQLISVSKVGPKLATVPGIGAKTAERLVLELRGKVQGIASAGQAAVPAAEGAGSLASEDAVAALVNLGYRAKDAERAVSRAAREGDGSLEAIIRRALALLSG